MKTFRAAVSAAGLALALSAGSTSAQVQLSIAGGPSFPLGTLGDVVEMGYHAQVSGALSLPLLPVGVRVDGMINRFPEAGDNFQVLSGSVNAILSIPSIGITPYLIGGLGAYNSRFTDAGEPGHEHEEGSTTNVGANIGAGVRLGLPGLSAFAEARLHNLFSEGSHTRFVPLSLGLSF